MIKKAIYFIAALLLIAVLSGCFIQTQDEYSIIVRLGEYSRTVYDPGISLKLPFIETRYAFTKRTLPFDSPPVTVITKDKQNIIFDSVAMLRITDPYKFYVKFRDVTRAKQFVDDLVYNAVRVQAGKYNFEEIIHLKREESLAEAMKYANDTANPFGLKFEIITFKRVFFPQSNEAAIYRSMVADRDQIAGKLEAEGKAESLKMRSEAEKNYAIIIAAARQKAEIMRGKADAEAQQMISQTTTKAPGLYLYLKKLQFYKDTIKNTPMILKPEGGILDTLKGPDGKNGFSGK